MLCFGATRDVDDARSRLENLTEIVRQSGALSFSARCLHGKACYMIGTKESLSCYLAWNHTLLPQLTYQKGRGRINHRLYLD